MLIIGAVSSTAIAFTAASMSPKSWKGSTAGGRTGDAAGPGPGGSWTTPHLNMVIISIHGELEGGEAGATRTAGAVGGEAGPQELLELKIKIWNKDLT